jgi:predicted DNA-binding transcriptional regulator AlpA
MDKPLALIPLEEALRRVGLKKSAVYRDMQRGIFPKIVKVGGKSLLVEHEVEDFIRRCIAQRDAAAGTDAARAAHRARKPDSAAQAQEATA